ncbi:VWA domain-containing protein [Halorientalis brevis]|uniref:VWA domain-containing protein n=1 Tax=Halorientalis brevis TaxID=1126241 RepID=A0ABD6CAT1_9EURY|nr:vWA domain-containing protein [Halorientalis brevis]
MSDISRLRGDRRGASEVIGYVILVGIVLTSVLLIAVNGSTLIDDAQNDVNHQSAQLVLQELDSRFSTLSSLSDVTRIRFDLGDTAPRDLSVRRDGVINITVNRNVSHTGGPDCQTTVNITSIRYEEDRDQVVGYEVGGVWRGNPGGGTVMQTSPDVTFQNGTLDVSAINLSGRITQNSNEAILNETASATVTARKTGRVLSGACVRPDNVTLKVNGSIFYQAWGDYLESEVGHARTFEENQTALTYVRQDELSEVANDVENNVVNLTTDGSQPDYMTENGPGATISASATDSKPAHISVDKGAANTYTVQYQPLSNSTAFSISNKTQVVQSLAETGVSSDAVFVLDESGSMLSNDLCDSCGSRMSEAKEAAAGSLPVLNTSDRAGVVGYSASARILRPEDEHGNEHLLTSNMGDRITSWSPSGVNESIAAVGNGGSTCIYCGLSSALHTLSAASNQTRNQTVVLLTDGQNNVYPNSDVKDVARRAAARNVTVYTVRIGGPADGLLKKIADITGGEYKDTSDPEELREFFRESLTTTVTRTQIRRTAVSTNASIEGGRVFEPFVAGDTDEMATGNGEFLNVNDPLAPSTFRHAFAVDDGETVYLNATWYGCGDNHDDDGDGKDEPNWTVTPLVQNGHQVVRCNDPNEDNANNISDENITVYTDGYLAGIDKGSPSGGPGGDPQEFENIRGSTPLLANESAPWEQNMTMQLSSHLEREVNGTRLDYRLNLSSNEAIVVYNYSVASEDDPLWNRLALIYRVGHSEQEARPEDIINIRVRNVRMRDAG